MPRFRQSFDASPPNAPFERNFNSIQSADLVGWWVPGRYPGINYGIPDLAGNLPATMVGSMAWRYDPVLGWSYDWVADKDKYLSIGLSPLTNPTDTMSITSWIVLDDVSTSFKIMDRDSNVTGRAWWFGTYHAQLDVGSDSNIVLRNAGPTMSVGVPYFVACTGKGNTWKIYVNGVLGATDTQYGMPPSKPNTPTLIGRGTYTNYESPFNGMIGDTRFYHRNLTANEIWQMYDPITRWELYKPLRRFWAPKAGGAVSPPTAPTTLTATAISSSEIDLTWIDTSADETGFKIYRSTDGITFVLYDTAAADATTYNDVVCAADTRYWYKVCATNAAGDSAFAGPADAKTALDSAAKAQKFLFIMGGQVEQSDGRYLALVDGVPTPDTVAGIGWLYIDQADGDLKMKFGDGTIKTIVVDT